MDATNIHEKVQALERHLAALDCALVAFSGGVDSSFLLALCIDVLGPEKTLAVTVDSPLLPRHELDMAKRIAAQLGAPHKIVPMDELSIPEIATNPPDRCYYCKHWRFTAMQELAVRENSKCVLLHGENADDQYDYRPGSRAARELGIRAPLAEVGLTKEEIRILSRERGLPTWDYPSAACLASRFPYGVPLTQEGLARVEAAEAALHALLNTKALRVRDHFPIARIEVPAEMIAMVAAEPLRGAVYDALRQVGYRYITVDLAGYRMGSMNEELGSSHRTSQ